MVKVSKLVSNLEDGGRWIVEGHRNLFLTADLVM
jgi:hypothetical protein